MIPDESVWNCVVKEGVSGQTHMVPPLPAAAASAVPCGVAPLANPSFPGG